MSFFVTRPPVPVPVTAFGSTPCSAAIRATTGDTNVRPLPEPGSAGAGAGARDLGVDLVGGDLEQGLVLGDGVAWLLEPLRDRPLVDRDAHLGHHDLDLCSRCHVSS